jgi:hypothetical protein
VCKNSQVDISRRGYVSNQGVTARAVGPEWLIRNAAVLDTPRKATTKIADSRSRICDQTSYVLGLEKVVEEGALHGMAGGVTPDL